MDMSGLGNQLGYHHTEAYREFNEISNQSEVDYVASQAASSSSSRMPGFLNARNAKLAGMGLVAGAVVGVIVVPMLSKRKIISKSKSWQVASVGAAIATPLVAAYA
jgi:hypothetical protein